MKANIILLIDDNEVDNYVTRQLLLKNEAAQNIIVQSSGTEALAFLKSIGNQADLAPDYIFLDIRMPEMDGFDFLDEYALFPEEIRNHCTVFILTSSGDQDDMDRAANYACVKKFLKKPLNQSIIREL